MSAYLDGWPEPLSLQGGCEVVWCRLPCGDEVSVSDGYTGLGPFAQLHPAGKCGQTDDLCGPELEADYDDVDGVEVVRVVTPYGDVLFPSRLVPVVGGPLRFSPGLRLGDRCDVAGG